MMSVKNILSLLLLITLMLAASVVALSSTVIVVDTSARASSFLPQQLVEVRELLGHVPEGERVTIVRTAPTTRAVFDSKLDAQTRLNLGVALATLRAARGNGDLGASLAMAASLAARETGPQRIILMTSAQPQPSQRSAFYGKSLAEILADKKVLPDSVDVVVVRVYGSAALSINRPNMRIVNAAPQWEKDVLVVHPNSALTAPTPSSAKAGVQERFGTWVVAGVIVLVAFVVLMAFARRQQRAKVLLQREAEEEAQILSRAGLAEEEAEPEREVLLAFSVDMGEKAISLKEGQRVLMGDRWDADAQFDANGACARLSAHQDALLIENVGTGVVHVGTFALLPGLSKRLPPKYIELTIGRRIISVMPEVFEADAKSFPDEREQNLLSRVSVSLNQEEIRK